MFGYESTNEKGLMGDRQCLRKVPVRTQAPEGISRGLCPHRPLFRVAYKMATLLRKVPVRTQAPEGISRGLCPHRPLFRVAYEMATMFAEGACEDTGTGKSRVLWGVQQKKPH